jgi:hypothetical protein
VVAHERDKCNKIKGLDFNWIYFVFLVLFH